MGTQVTAEAGGPRLNCPEGPGGWRIIHEKAQGDKRAGQTRDNCNEPCELGLLKLLLELSEER
jgi:hypothetical protein